MATASVAIGTDNLACPECFKQFKLPRVLPCLHTFCEECLDSYIKSHVQSNLKFLCPDCGKLTVPPNSKLAVEKWASSFPLNDIIIYLFETEDDSEQTDNLCQPCKNMDKTSPAEFMCTECQEWLCKYCKRNHEAEKILRHHRIVKIDEMSKRQRSDMQLSFIQNCPRHRGQRLESYCIQHGSPCCAVCVAESHKKCNYVDVIADVTDKQTISSAYENTIKGVKEIQENLGKLVSDKSDNVERIDLETEQILQEMEDMVDKDINNLKKLRQKFRDETERIRGETKRILRQNDKNLQSFVTSIANYRNVLDRFEKKTSPSQKLVILENLRSQILPHYQQMKRTLKDENGDVHLRLKPNKFIEDVKKSLTSLGTVETSAKTSAVLINTLKQIDDKMENLNSQMKISTEICAAQVEKCDLMTSPVTYVTSMTREKLGKTTWFIGGTVLIGGRLVMVDYRNNRLVELDDQYNVVKEYKIDGQPTDVAAGNKDNEIYIAVNYNSVYKCTLDTELTVTSRIKGPDGTCGIAVSDDNIIVRTHKKVMLITQDGVKQIPIPVINIYSYLNYFSVAVSRTQRTLCHRHGLNDVVCLTLEGEEQFRYQHQQLERPAGMCLDGDGNLYVCGSGSKNVHQISPVTQTGRVLVNKLHHISTPWCVVYIPHKNELLVTSRNEDNEDQVMEVYRLG